MVSTPVGALLRGEGVTKKPDTLRKASGWAFGRWIHGTLPSRFRSSLVPGLEDPEDFRHNVTVAYYTVDTLPDGDEFRVTEPQEPLTRGRLALLRLDGALGLTGATKISPRPSAIFGEGAKRPSMRICELRAP